MRYWQALPYRKKNQFLWLAAGLFLLLAYRVAISPTVEAYGHYRELTGQMQSASAAPERLTALGQELRQAERFLVTGQADSSRTDLLLAGLAPFCQRQGVRIEALPPAQAEKRDNYRIVTRSVRLAGSYANLVQVIYHLEHRLRAGRVASVQFSVREDLLRGTRTLYADCYLQQLHQGAGQE